MRETWYVLEDGNLADPAEVTADEAGRLVHSSGVAVEMKGDVPRSRGVDDPAAERAKSAEAKAKAEAKDKADAEAKAKAKADAEAKAKELKPDEPKRGYQTRESKAD